MFGGLRVIRNGRQPEKAAIREGAQVVTRPLENRGGGEVSAGTLQLVTVLFQIRGQNISFAALVEIGEYRGRGSRVVGIVR